MAETLESLRALISSDFLLTGNEFRYLQGVAALLADPEQRSAGHDLLLRALDKREKFAAYDSVVVGLTRHAGLFPYLDPDNLSLRDQIAFEMHRPEAMANNIVFHRGQSHVYGRLVEGKNVVLSAPTSFGKSLIIDAIIARGKFRNIVIVVPTIALMDETRRRLMRLGGGYKLITHTGQEEAERNIYILTPERVNERPDVAKTEFFVIDEFYKLDPARADDATRTLALNQAFYRLWKTGAQFYLLGPNVKELVTMPAEHRAHFEFIPTDYTTVAADVYRVKVAGEEKRLAQLVEICSQQTQPTLIYVRSPSHANTVARHLVEADLGSHDHRNDPFVEWIRATFHPDWTFAKAFQSGIGIHHGRLPRSVAQYVVRAFNGGRLRFLICTSTLIEGVNTAAKSVIIFDNKIAKEKFDYFTFNNIKGRAGRMLRHFVGKVYIFHDSPVADLPSIEMPIFSQGETATKGLLIQMEDEDLTVESRSRIEGLRKQSDLSLETIRANATFDPDAQIRLARELASNPRRSAARLGWVGYPNSYDQLLETCETLWTFLLSGQHYRGEVKSGSQLAFKINQLRRTRDIQALIQQEINDGLAPDDAVEQTLSFVRHWPTFHFPNALMAMDRIQREVFTRSGLSPGDYSPYAVQVESLFVEPALLALEEYGIPIQIALKLESALEPKRGLDHVLTALRSLKIDTSLPEFEQTLLRDARRTV